MEKNNHFIEFLGYVSGGDVGEFYRAKEDFLKPSSIKEKVMHKAEEAFWTAGRYAAAALEVHGLMNWSDGGQLEITVAEMLRQNEFPQFYIREKTKELMSYFR
jgi:hypothetical protein